MQTVHAKGFSKSDRYAFQVPGGLVGRGRGDDGTLLRVDDHTSTSGHLVPKDAGTNPLYVLRTTGKKDVTLAGFTLDGGVQGHLYNGFRVESTIKPLVREVRVVRVPGDDDVPPGETFGGNAWKVEDLTLTDCEFDGAHVAASGMGYNSSLRGTTTRVTAHDHKWCKGFALWQHRGGHLFRQVESLGNAFAFGFERCEGTYRLERCKFRGSTRADVHLASDTSRAKVILVDPDLGGKKLKVLLPAKEMSRKNYQTRDDLTVTVHGQPRPDLVEWVTHA